MLLRRCGTLCFVLWNRTKYRLYSDAVATTHMSISTLSWCAHIDADRLRVQAAWLPKLKNVELLCLYNDYFKSR